MTTRTNKSYLGGGVQLLDSSCSAELDCTPGDRFGIAGLCGRRFDIRRATKLGALSVVNSEVAFGSSGDPTLDAQSIDVRCTYATDATTNESGSTNAVLVGPGLCNQAPMNACLINTDCTTGTCAGRKAIDDPTNAYVDRTGTTPQYLACTNAINQLVTTGQAISALAGADISTLSMQCCSDATFTSCPTPYTASRNNVSTSSRCNFIQVQLASGPQVINVGSVKVKGGAILRLIGDETTVAVMNVSKLSTGGSARVEFTDAAGTDLDPAKLLWNLKGTGAPASLKGNTFFTGTIFAAERSGGIKTGASVTVHGALLGQKLKLLANTKICHAPFCAVAP